MFNNPDTSLSNLMFGLRRLINKSDKENRLKHELTVSQFETLWFIGPTGRRTMESIADHLNIKPPSVTALVDKLEKSGLVAREKDPADRRLIQVVLTKKMIKELQVMGRKKELVFDKIISKLSPADQKELERILSILIKK